MAYSRRADEDARAAHCTAFAASARGVGTIKAAHWRRTISVPESAQAERLYERKHNALCAIPHGLSFARNRARLSRHCVNDSKRAGLEGGRDRTSIGACREK